MLGKQFCAHVFFFFHAYSWDFTVLISNTCFQHFCGFCAALLQICGLRRVRNSNYGRKAKKEIIQCGEFVKCPLSEHMPWAGIE